MLKKIFNWQTKSVSAASFILAAAYFFSAALGLLRDRILASVFGASRDLDIYYTAFKIPDFIATIFVFGAITAAIIPVFSRYLVKSKKDAWDFVANLLNLFLFFLIPVCFVLIILSPYLIKMVAPGFGPEDSQKAILLLRIMFLSPIILGLSHIISGILQIFKRFFVTALAPSLYNIGIIIGALFFTRFFGLAGLALGVVLGALIHLAIQIPAFLASGFRIKRMFNIKEAGFIDVVKLMAPRSLGLAASQINLIVVIALASTFAKGSIAVFNLASNLSGALTNLVAISVGTAIFPLLSLAFAGNKKEVFIANISLVLRVVVFLLLPISFFVFAFKEPIVRTFFGAGSFGVKDILLTSSCLGIFCFGVLFQGLNLIMLKAFYALHNTKTPALISVAAVLFNIVCAFWLSRQEMIIKFLAKITALKKTQDNLAVISLPLALSLAGILQFFLLGFFLYKLLGNFGFSKIFSSICKILLASLVMFIFAVFMMPIFDFLGWFLQSATVGVLSVFVFLVVCFYTKTEELSLTRSIILRGLKLNRI